MIVVLMLGWNRLAHCHPNRGRRAPSSNGGPAEFCRTAYFHVNRELEGL